MFRYKVGKWMGVKTMNLLKETLDALKENGKTPADVRWVGRASINAKCNWEDFAKQANFEYDNSCGWMEIPADLVAVGDDWWLEREEDDGAEWWEFKAIPKVEERGSHAFSRDLSFGTVDRLRITHDGKSGYYELLEAPENDDFKAKGIFKQKGANYPFQGSADSQVRYFYVEGEKINVPRFLDMIGTKREFAFSARVNGETFSEVLVGEIRTVSFFDGNVVKLTVEVLAQIK